jgi:hypothetical protein
VSAKGAVGGFLGLSVLPAATAGSNCGDAGIAARPDVVQLDLSTGDKNLTITWSKSDTLADPRNGKPFWPVCMTAMTNFVTSAGTQAWSPSTPGDQQPAWVSGLLPNCGASFLSAADPCVVLSRRQAQEIATVKLPAAWPGDPYFH